mgnify:CR=1 FL=1
MTIGKDGKYIKKGAKEYEEGLKRGEGIQEYNLRDIKSQDKEALKNLEAAVKARFGRSQGFEDQRN